MSYFQLSYSHLLEEETNNLCLGSFLILSYPWLIDILTASKYIILNRNRYVLLRLKIKKPTRQKDGRINGYS